MMTINDVGTVALGAAYQAAEYIVENICANPTQPTPQEAEAVSTALIITITALETNLKMNLPEEVRHNARAAIESLSASLGVHIEDIMKEHENALSKAAGGDRAGEPAEGKQGRGSTKDPVIVVPGSDQDQGVATDRVPTPGPGQDISGQTTDINRS